MQPSGVNQFLMSDDITCIALCEGKTAYLLKHTTPTLKLVYFITEMRDCSLTDLFNLLRQRVQIFSRFLQRLESPGIRVWS